MQVTLLSHTENPGTVIATAARVCYSSLNIHHIELTPTKEVELLKSLLDKKHLSPFEHATFTFAIDGISRTCSHQLVRHRLASYSQRSQRYVRTLNPDWCVPDSITKSSYYAEYLLYMQDCLTFYEELVNDGVPEEDARYVLPNACDTQLMMTMNARELMHFCEVRLCNRAQAEIQNLAGHIAGLLITKFPTIFKGSLLPPCLIYGECPEGDYKCGRPLPDTIKALK